MTHPTPTTADQVREALRAAGIDGWEYRQDSFDGIVLWHPGKSIHLAVYPDWVQTNNYYLEGDWAPVVALTRSVLQSGTPALVATRLGLPYTVDALLGWCEARGWMPTLSKSYPYWAKSEDDASWGAGAHGSEFPPGIAKTYTEALALACLKAADAALVQGEKP